MVAHKKKSENIETTTKTSSKRSKKVVTEAIVYPRVIKGTHLTVIDHAPGHTELVWDDDQLLKEVREAIASVA